jgi:DNA-binding CsgD family transcriptional regulator
MARSTRAPPLVGRDEELARIETFLDGVNEGRAAVLLEGEPGIGKTTLWRRAVYAARRRGFHVLVAQPTEAESRLSFAGLGDLLDPVRAEISALPAPARRALRLALLDEEPKGHPPERRAFGVALIALLQSLAATAAVVIGIDDVQWLDEATLTTLAFALRRLEAVPVAFVGAIRTGAEAADLADERIPIGPLSTGSLGLLIRERLGVQLLPPALAEIERASGGNPFYALEFARALEDHGPLEPGDPLPLPGSLRAIVARYLEGLSRAARDQLLLIAVAAQPERGLIDRTSSIEGALRSGLLVESRGRVRLAHPLFASALLADADPEHLRAIHGRLAEAVTDIEPRARHLAAAATSPDEPTAVEIEQAATHALARGARASAVELAQAAVRLTPPGNARRQRTLWCADLAFEAGATQIARDLLEDLRIERGDAAVWWRIGNVRRELDANDAALEAYDRAIAAAGDDTAMLAAAHHSRAHVEYFTVGPATAFADAQRAVELAEECHDPALLAQSLCTLGRISFSLGHGLDDELYARAMECEARADTLRADVRPSLVYGIQLVSADAHEARDRLEQALELARRTGEPLHIQLHWLSLLEHRAGRWDQAQEYAEEAIRFAEQSGHDPWLPFGLHPLAMVLAHRGEEDQARRAIARLLELAASSANPTFAVGARELLGFLALIRGDAQEAVEQLAPGHDELIATGVREPGRYFFLPDEVEALVRLGQIDEAEQRLGWFEEAALRLDRPWARAVAARSRGLIAGAAGTSASELFDQALAQHLRVDVPFERARSQLAYGAYLRRQRKRREARTLLESAGETFRRLGASSWHGQVERELGQLGGRAASSGQLTATERRVAELVASGMSNHEAASELFMSPKTVEWNLSKVYKKLHVASRTELAAKLAKR